MDRLGIIKPDSEENYLAHLLCLGGTCRYRFNNKEFELHAGDLSIIRRRDLIENVQTSDDFRCKIIYAKPGFIELCTPQSNYGTKGSLALFLNPVIHLLPEQQIICRQDYDILEARIKNVEHRFYRETLISAMQATILDISRQLRNRSLTFVQISDMFGFSSPAYFSRYVQQYLGVTPSNYRE